MQTLFRYNWQVREEWYQWCEELPEEELVKARIGGVGGILQTLVHIVDVELSWVRDMEGKPDIRIDFPEYNTLHQIREVDARFRPEVESFIVAWNEGLERRILREDRPDGQVTQHTWGEVIRHVIAHEIHHIGQLSIWSRELGRKPVSPNLIGRGLAEYLPGKA
ncbi:DinB family protein [Paenibacillus sp. FSL H7-0756]|uniref:DinB family protein n=1 Tax=Paenibacillus sp. FSL H7-0756 TaxID=2954738 RepID=UPI0030FAD871